MRPRQLEALRLANEVVWTVTRESDGMWLNLTHRTERVVGVGVGVGVGGDWRRDEDG